MRIFKHLFLSLFLTLLSNPSLSYAGPGDDIPGAQEVVPQLDASGPAASEKPKTETGHTELRDISEISLEELLSEEITVATSKPLNLREIPAVITILTREELELLGVRDLMDVLMLVPGFEPALDVWGNTSVGFRGIWAYEGKALILLDGHSLVERAYTNVTLGSRFSIDQIERIEIIRGPGSAIYGREAELMVVNIVTRIGKEFKGVAGSYTSGYFASGGSARQNFHISLGRDFGDDTYLGISLYGGFNKRTNRNYTDIYGSTINFGDTNSLSPDNLLLNFRWRDLKVKFLYEDYRVGSIDGYSDILPYTVEAIFRSYNVDVSKPFKFNDKYSITPQFKFSRQRPWNNTKNYSPIDSMYYAVTSDRYSTDLKFTYEPAKSLHFLLGTNYEFDHAAYAREYPATFQNGKNSISYHNFALYSEATAKTFLGNPTAGVRFEHHNVSGNSIVPRFGLTKLLGDFHAKFIYNRAFRTPSIEQFNGASNIGFDLKPEKTQVIETEVGYNFKNQMFVTLGFFDISIKDPIGYFYDTVTDQDTYVNYNKVGTRGLETEYRFIGKRGHVTLSYSYYAKTSDDTNQFYTDPLSGDRFLAFPNHKVSAYGSLRLFGNFYVSPSLIFVSEKSAYTSLDSITGDPVASRVGSDVFLNVYFMYKNLFVRGMDFGVGMYDILNSKPLFVQPYNGYHSPIPGPSRMIVFNLSYSWEDSKKGN